MMLQDNLPNNANKKDKYDANKKLSISYCRARLGKTADGKTDEEIICLRNLMYQFVEATYTVHKQRYNKADANIQR